MDERATAIWPKVVLLFHKSPSMKFMLSETNAKRGSVKDPPFRY